MRLIFLLLAFPIVANAQLSPDYGGTGRTWFEPNGVLLGGVLTSTPLQQVPYGTAGYVLTSNGTSAPSWQAGGGGGDTSCVIYGGWGIAFDGGYVGLTFANAPGGYVTIPDSIFSNKSQPTMMNTAGKLSHFLVREAKTLDSTGCSCAGSDTFQLYKNGSLTAIQVVIPLGSRMGVDSVNSVTVAEGDLMQYHETSGSLGISPMAFSILNNISASSGGSSVPDSIVGDTGTIPPPSSSNLQLIILKPSSTANYTLAPPTYGMNGYRLFFFTVANDTAVVTCSNGFNGKGSSGTITTYGFAGDGAVLIAWGGSWFISPKNITIQ